MNKKQLTPNRISCAEAVEMLPKNETIHTFINPNGMLIGADWPRQKVLDLIFNFGATLAGIQATALKHGLAVLEDGKRWVFIETVDAHQGKID